LRALRAGFPGAHIALLGLPWTAELVRRLHCVDEFIEFPGHPDLPERQCSPEVLATFAADMRERHFDLAIQLHGSGSVVNPLVASFGAVATAGFRTSDGWCPAPDRSAWAIWPARGHEIERLLELTDHLGLPRQGLQLDFPVNDTDRTALREAWPGIDDDAPFVCLHAGAQLASRRWRLSRFAAVADALHASGRTVVLTGTAGEAALVAGLVRRMRAPAVDLCGRTTIWTLGALLERASLVVCNDTGISHVAAALSRPSVVISSGSDVSRWAPLERRLHEVLWRDVPCRPCSHADCPSAAHDCAEAVTVADVLAAVRRRDAGATTQSQVCHA
jgi:ADP-heptose:LPS heptosyltransferase